MGAGWLYGARGLYVALIAGGALNLAFALCSHVWQRGFVAAERGGLSVAANARGRQQIDLIQRITAERDQLLREVARMSTPPENLLARYVQLIGGRRMALAPVHPDREKEEAKKPALTARFQETAALLERAGVR
jgi:hypothetical protein